MNLNRKTLVNVLIAAAAAIAFGGFVFLAEGGDKRNDSLDAIASTTTQRPVTTSTAPTTSTTFGATTTTVALTTPTTARATPTTKKASTTPTTKKATPTTVGSGGPSGPANERTDNTASFTHGPDGSFGVSSTDPPGGSDPFRFTIKTAPGSGGVSGDSASVKFTLSLTNNTARAISFPTQCNDNDPKKCLKIIVTLKSSGGADIVFAVTASDVTNILAGETITITQERGVSGFGTFDATATVDVDYG